ncbi:hypothetical protein [Pyrobaculum aerophilum]|uniref:Uncharacterized protein n=2 Tax=Pyrobaculum aerophilum TaxID=13773 RepID=Q8ZZH4_PYRAE|nr:MULTISPECIES: hypothetical protein [Pyrobaculum]AAL62666.1 hypothetical protein PAE0263 [Pyrobaculum aerophilum str. IM2]MCX8137178.1 transcriptional regulator [Pyrobaculum aerophilum]HII46718.1 transcriptional regulator [Pyrobaculum aerophilum]
MNKYIAAALAVAVFIAVLSIAAPRLAPVLLRIGLAALLIIGAFWLYELLTSRPSPLAQRVLNIVKAKGPVTLRELALETGAGYEEVASAVDYLVERGLLRKFKKNGEEYYDL